ncbi:uncharacterized protein LOC132700082 [Cylas formicarius]|uniref:uncharacterized protein LOC132700082 n=1 Tax=Cylas formicarius TaxID=197179 RepID=UPI002958B875|nr:uncharacterized protein LOC132700082 [Cylas formicarius]
MCSLALTCFVISFCATSARNLITLYEWSQVEYDYPSESARQRDIDSGNFKEGNPVPFDVDVFHRKNDKVVFVTTPKWTDGVPAVLGTVTKKKRKGNPVIRPYPSWDWHKQVEICKDKIVSVWRVFVDECDRLWVADSGKAENEQICQPQILIFDTNTDRLLHRHEIPEKIHYNISMYGTIVPEVIDHANRCGNTFAYIADTDASSLVVYDLRSDRSWKIVDRTFLPIAEYTTLNIAGQTFPLSDGLIGLALTPHGMGKRKLFYHALSSDAENWVYTDHLHNETLFTEPFGTPNLFHTFPNDRKTPSAAEAIDGNGNLYFALLSASELVRWNVKQDEQNYRRKYFKTVEISNRTLPFISGIKVAKNEKGDEMLWVVSNSLQKAMTNNLTINVTNFRILYGEIRKFKDYNYRTMKMSNFLSTVYTFTLLVPIINSLKNLKVEYEWSQLEFDYANESVRQRDIDSGIFNVGKCLPLDVQVYYKGKRRITFVTVPKFETEVPATLGIVTHKRRKGNPIIKPYPSWDWHVNSGSCENKLYSVYRIFADDCDRLWVIDSGRIGDENKCPPVLFIFDLLTDTLIRSYKIPEKYHMNISLYVTPVVEIIDSNCANSFAYVSDVEGSALLVYDYKRDNSWRVRNKTFLPEINFTTFHHGGETFSITDGLMALALSPLSSKRKLFYHSLSGSTEHWVYTEDLRNDSRFAKSQASPKLFHNLPYGRGVQSGPEAIDKNGNLYFGFMGPTEIATWNIYRRPETHSMKNFKIIDSDKDALQFPGGLKVTPNENGDEILWVLTNSYQKLATNHLNTNQINVRILYGFIKEF